MPSPDLVGCSSCQSILDVLCSIDSRLTKFADNNYRNISFELNKYYPKDVVKILLTYRRIMNAKLFNPSYTDYTSSQLISRIKVLINE